MTPTPLSIRSDAAYLHKSLDEKVSAEEIGEFVSDWRVHAVIPKIHYTRFPVTFT